MLGVLLANRKIRAGFKASERGDLDGLMSVFGDDAVLVYPSKGTMDGKAAIRAFYRHFMDTFPKVQVIVHHICVENIFDVVGTNVITAHWDVLTTNRRGQTFKQTGIQIFETSMGRVKYLEYFFADTDHLRAAWKESE